MQGELQPAHSHTSEISQAAAVHPSAGGPYNSRRKTVKRLQTPPLDILTPARKYMNNMREKNKSSKQIYVCFFVNCKRKIKQPTNHKMEKRKQLLLDYLGG